MLVPPTTGIEPGTTAWSVDAPSTKMRWSVSVPSFGSKTSRSLKFVGRVGRCAGDTGCFESALDTDDGDDDVEKCTVAGGRSDWGSVASLERRNVNAQGMAVGSGGCGLSRTRTRGDSSVDEETYIVCVSANQNRGRA